MLLFTQGATTLGGSPIPVGAFSMYVIPGRDEWTLIVNRNVTPGVQVRPRPRISPAPPCRPPSSTTRSPT